MYHTLSWFRNGKLNNKKSEVNSEGLYKNEMDSVPPKKRVY